MDIYITGEPNSDEAVDSFNEAFTEIFGEDSPKSTVPSLWDFDEDLDLDYLDQMLQAGDEQ
jgi:hypothetical protein